MKKQHIILALTFGAFTGVLCAQQGKPPGGGPDGPGGKRPPSPIIEALDLNKDGVIDADEIAKAPQSLLKLDKNGDGKLTEDEFRPKRPEGGGPGGGGQGGNGGAAQGGPGKGGNGGGQGGPQGGPRGKRPPSPIIEALDLNKDGVIDASEIAKAAKSLLKLDKNGDGKLTEDEFRPKRPDGPGGQGGPGGKAPK
jgi:hypothetical protein